MLDKINDALNTVKYIVLSALAIAGVILVAIFARKTPNASGQIRRDIEREQEAIRKRQARRRARLDDYPVEPRV